MSVGNILAIIELLGALSGQPDSTGIEQKVIESYRNQDTTEIVIDNPITLETETGIIYNSEEKEIPFQRFQVEIDGVLAKYDYLQDIKENPSNVFSITYNGIYEDSTSSLNAAFFNIGNWDDNDERFVEIFGTKKFENNNTTLIYGHSFSNHKPTEYVLGELYNNSIFVKGALISEGSLFTNKLSPYGVVSYDFGNAYLGTGYGNHQHTGFLGVKGYEDFGTFSFGTYNLETGKWKFKSQTGFGDVSKGFFSKNTFDFASSYTTIPAFHTTHFSPLMTKGDYTVRISGWGDRNGSTLEAMLGMKTNIVDFGIGYTTNNDAELELYKQLDILGVKGSLDFKYMTNGEMSGYIVTHVEL